MNVDINILSLYLLVAGSLAGFAAITSISRAGEDVKAFAQMMASLTVWCMAYAFELSSTTLPMMMLWVKVEYLGVALMPAFWLIFCLKFSGFDKSLPPLWQKIAYVYPSLTLLLVWTNEYHYLHYASYSIAVVDDMNFFTFTPAPWYYVHVCVFYGYLLSGMVLLLKKISVVSATIRRQTYMIIAGAIIPWVANLGYLLGLKPFGVLDLTPFAFVVTGLLTSVALLRFQLFKLLPYAREKIIETANEGIIILDDRAIVLDHNPRSTIVLNMQNQDLNGKHLDELIPNQNVLLELVYSGHQATAVVGIQSETYEVFINPLRRSSGDRDGVFLVFRDITSEMEIQNHLITAKAQAEAASWAKSEFLANMSHEIRTPLNGVIGFTDLLSETELDKQQREYLGLINQSAHTLLDLISDILDFSKIESGKLELDLLSTDLYELCRQAGASVILQVKAKSIGLEINIDEDVPRFLVADSIRLRQILINLLSNAVKFTHEGEVELSVDVVRTDSEAPRLRFAVRDTGIGISPENQSRIFDVFTQADTSATRQYGGTGLGLAICTRLLQLMGSSLQLESTINAGSTFFFELDVKVASERDSLSHALQASDLPPPAKKTDRLSILIVEDNALNMRLSQTLLSQLYPDAVLYQAVNGLEAVERFHENHPSLILMDIQMPEMNGYEATAQIRTQETTYRTPIIALTAGTLVGEYERCIEAGMDDYMTKPIGRADLKRMIDKWIPREVLES